MSKKKANPQQPKRKSRRPSTLNRDRPSLTPLVVRASSSYYNTFRGHQKEPEKADMLRLSTETLLILSFWLFGTLVTMQFGVVVTAANDLVGTSAPPGLVLFAYTLPSIIVRAFVPYIRFPDIQKIPSLVLSLFSRTPRNAYLRVGTPIFSPHQQKQEVNYAVRLSICACSSFLGLQLLAWADNVGIRVLGIAFASLSSNLGDMSFYQLATRYPAMISKSFGGYAAGSGAAGLLGSFAYTLFTSSGASPSSVLSAIGLMPTIMLLTYFFILPPPEVADEEEEEISKEDTLISSLQLGDKLRLVLPMVWGYMLPLALLMFLENITTQGILPTVLWHITPNSSGIFKSTRDFYPFFFTLYQLAIFFGRTSITFFRLPGGNTRSSKAYWTLCILETICTSTMLLQSISMTGPTDATVAFPQSIVGTVMFSMGLCGGLGMSNTYWRVSKKPLPPSVWEALDTARRRQHHGIHTPIAPSVDEDYFSPPDPRPRLRKTYSSFTGDASMAMLEPTGSRGDRQRSQQEETAVREFLISTIALPDTVAIMVASVVSLWLQPLLCQWQVAGSRELCVGGVQ